MFVDRIQRIFGTNRIQALLPEVFAVLRFEYEFNTLGE